MKKSTAIVHGIYIVICIALFIFALIQKTMAIQHLEVANKNAIEAQKNAHEALRQQGIAEENANGAFRQMEIVRELKAKLEECENRNKVFDSFEELKKGN